MFVRLVRADLKMIVRNKQALFWALLFPIIFTVVFGLFDFEDFGRTTVGVTAEDQARAAPVVAALRSMDAVEYDEEARTEDELRAAVEDGDVDFGLVVPGRGPVVALFKESQADQNRIFLPVMRQVLDEVNIRLAGIRRAYTLEARGVGGREVSYYDFVLPGLVGMAVMTYGIIGLASTIAQYRGQRILRRILATPLPPRTFLGSIVVAHLLLALVQSALVLVTGIVLFNGNVRGNLLMMAVFVVIANVTFLNIGFMVASRAESAEAASGLGNAVAMPMMFFSGVFFPTASLPWIMPELTAALPLRPLVDAVREISIDSASITDLVPQLAMLLGWALATFFLASRVFRFERA